MNGIDLAIIIIMGISCIIGFIRGVTREILGLLTWVGAAAATYFSVPLTGGFTRAYIANPMIADGITACVLFIVYLILFSIISGTIANSVRESSLGGVDRSLGFAYGIIRGVVLLCAAELGLSAFVARPNQATNIQQAQFTPLLRRGADNLVAYLPAKIGEMISIQAGKAMENATTAAKQKLEEQATKSVENMMPLLPGITGSQTRNPKASPSVTTAPPAFKQSSIPKVAEEDPEKTMEALAQLKPQASESKTKDGDYDKRQKRDMDRLIQTTQ